MVLAVGVARAQGQDPKADAREHAHAAAELLEQGKHAEALERIGRAEALYHAPIHLLIQAEALEGLGRLADATAAYERLAVEPLPATAPEVFRNAQEKARAKLRDLIARVPSLHVRVSGATPAEVRATLDGKPFVIGPSAQRIDPGSRKLRVEARGRRAFERVLALEAKGGVTVVDVLLEPEGLKAAPAPPPPAPLPPAPGAAPERPEEPPSGGGSFVPAIVAFGVGAAGLIAGSITGAMSLGKVGELEEDCPGGRCSTAEHQDLIDEAGLLGNVSTALFIVGGAGVATGVVLLIVRPSLGEDDARPTARVTPWIGAGGAGLLGRF
jgi:hypothetical protein